MNSLENRREHARRIYHAQSIHGRPFVRSSGVQVLIHQGLWVGEVGGDKTISYSRCDLMYVRITNRLNS